MTAEGGLIEQWGLSQRTEETRATLQELRRKIPAQELTMETQSRNSLRRKLHPTDFQRVLRESPQLNFQCETIQDQELTGPRTLLATTGLAIPSPQNGQTPLTL